MNPASITLYTSFLIYGFLGFYGLRQNYRNMQNICFFFICTLFAWWAFFFALKFAAPTEEAALFWFRLSFPGWFLLGGGCLHFCLIMVNDPWLKKKWLYLLLYLPGFVFLYGAYSGYLTEIKYVEPFGYNGGTSNSNPLWYWSFALYYMGFVFLGIGKVIRWGKKTVLRSEKRQAQLISITGIISTVLVYLNGTLLPSLSIYILPRFPAVMVLFWAVGMWFAITRYRFMRLSLAVAADEIIARIEDLLVLINPVGNIARVNPSVEAVLGYRERELRRKPSELIISGEGSKETLNLLQQIRTGSLERFQEELYFKAKTGDFIPVRVSAAALKGVAGDLAGIVLVGKDLRETRQLQEEIEERKKVETELQSSLEKLKELDQMKTDFLSSVSHELRTPLTSILGFASIIKKRFDNVIVPLMDTKEKKITRVVRQLQDNISIIVSEGQRLTNLINEVLDIAKMEAGRFDWNMETISLSEVVKNAVAATKPLFQQKGLTLKQNLAEDLPLFCGDRDRLVQVFINLLSNSVKFTEKGSVTISAVRHGASELLVRVIDTGMGIKTEDHEKVFEKFKQAGDTLTDKPKGTGLGLPICKEILEYHGGRIWVESTLGQGSSFCFILPLNQTEEERDEASLGQWKDMDIDVTEQVEETQKKTILVVDDEENIRKYLQSELVEKGYQVSKARNGVEALEIIKKNKPHLIILDVNMPVMDGFQLLEILKSESHYLPIPVIMLTITDERERAMSLNVKEYLTKPFDMGVLLKKIDQLIS